MVRYTYRMTRDEFERLTLERDSVAEEFGAERTIRLVEANPDLEINLGHASVTYDAGWFWVKTTREVEWM